jgi:hypothetical protein
MPQSVIICTQVTKYLLTCWYLPNNLFEKYDEIILELFYLKQIDKEAYFKMLPYNSSGRYIKMLLYNSSV